MRFKYYLRGAGIGVIAATLVLSVAFLFHDGISDEEVIRRAMKLGMVMQENTSGTLADTPPSGASSVDLDTRTDIDGSTKTDTDPLSEPDNAGQDPASGTDAGQDPASGTDAGQQDPASGTDPDQQDAGSGTDAGQQQDPDGTDTGSQQDPASGSSQPSNDKADGSKSDGKKDTSSGNKPSGSKEDSNKEQDADNQSDTKDGEASDEVEIVIAAGDVSRMVSAKVFEAGLVDDADEFNAYMGAHDYDNSLQPGTYKIKKGSSFRQIARILTKQ